MRTLDRYIGRTFLAACLLILAVLIVFVIPTVRGLM